MTVKRVPPAPKLPAVRWTLGCRALGPLLVVPDGGLSLLGQLRRHFFHAVGSACMLGDLPHHLVIRFASGHEVAIRPHVPAIHSPRHSLSFGEWKYRVELCGRIAPPSTLLQQG